MAAWWLAGVVNADGGVMIITHFKTGSTLLAWTLSCPLLTTLSSPATHHHKNTEDCPFNMQAKEMESVQHQEKGEEAPALPPHG